LNIIKKIFTPPPPPPPRSFPKAVAENAIGFGKFVTSVAAFVIVDTIIDNMN
jgi:hypothetical protein